MEIADHAWEHTNASRGGWAKKFQVGPNIYHLF